MTPTPRKKVLWFDNDLDYLEPYVTELREAGHTVTTVGTLADADRELSANQFDLLILDVMIPTRSADEERLYPPTETDRGTSTGLLYYNKWKAHLHTAGTKIFILTVRLDKNIRAAFIDAGVPKWAVARKLDLRTVDDFTCKINQIFGASA